VADLIFVAIIVAFFAIAASFVRACDRIIGEEAESTDEPTTRAEVEQAA
jgi:hypothetical protein